MPQFSHSFQSSYHEFMWIVHVLANLNSFDINISLNSHPQHLNVT